MIVVVGDSSRNGPYHGGDNLNGPEGWREIFQEVPLSVEGDVNKTQNTHSFFFFELPTYTSNEHLPDIKWSTNLRKGCR